MGRTLIVGGFKWTKGCYAYKTGKHPGNIYYGTTDRIDPSTNLWSTKTIKKFSDSEPKESSDTRFEVTQSTLDRTDLIDLDADLGLSFMGGLVSAKGSAKYLDNRRSKKNEGKNPHTRSKERDEFHT